MAVILGIFNELTSWSKHRWYWYLAVFFLGMIMCQWQAERNKGNLVSLAGRQVALVGTVFEEPDLRGNTANYVIRVENPGLKGKILLGITSSKSFFSYGDKLRIEGVPEIPRGPGNPGEFNYPKYLETKGIRLVLKSRGGTGISKTGTGSINPLVNMCIGVKQRLVRPLEKSLPVQHAGLMKGILFGDCGQIDAGVRDDFALTGVIHILSVSGFHVGLLVSFCLFAGQAAGLSRIASSLFTVMVTALYAVMTGASPPVIRASVMAWLLLLAHAKGYRYNWADAMGLAAFAILLHNPHALFRAGFQLSFAATWGILYLAPLLQGFLRILPADGPIPGTTRAAVVALAAQLAVLPLSSYYFNYLSLVSLPANLVIVPVVSLLMLLGGFASLTGALWLPFAETVNISTGLILDLVIALSRFMAELPFAVVTVKSPPIASIPALYIGVIAMVETARSPEICLRLRRIWQLYRPQITIISLTLIAALICAALLHPPPIVIKAVFIAIGQGDAALVQSPAGRSLLIDAGGAADTCSSAENRSSFDPGERILLPLLRRHGIGTIDLMVLSHAHADHIQGAYALLGKIRVKMLAVNPQFCRNPDGSKLVRAFRAEGTQIRILSGGERILFDENIILEAFNPRKAMLPAGDENNNSLMMRLSYGELQVLFTGDAEQDELLNLLQSGASVEADIVKVPHHGARGSWLAHFYREVRPKAAVISVGPNYFGHPSAEVMDGLERLGIRVYRTDLDGAVTLRSDGRSYRIDTVRGR